MKKVFFSYTFSKNGVSGFGNSTSEWTGLSTVKEMTESAEQALLQEHGMEHADVVILYFRETW